MSGSTPWSVKGVSREDREIAKNEARKSGEPVGVWLSRRIRDGGGSPLDRRASSGQGAAQHEDQNHDLPAEGDRRQAGQSLGRRATDHPDFGFGPGNWRQARETILAREDSRHTEGLASLRDRVRVLETRLEKKPDELSALDTRIQALTGRIADLADRLESLEGARGLVGVERKVDRLETELLETERFVRRIPSDTSDSLDGLARRIEQLLDRMRVVETYVLPSRNKPGFFGRLFRRKSR